MLEVAWVVPEHTFSSPQCVLRLQASLLFDQTESPMVLRGCDDVMMVVLTISVGGIIMKFIQSALSQGDLFSDKNSFQSSNLGAVSIIYI